MILHRRLFAAFFTAVFATITILAQERTALHVTIGGAELPADAQPRVVVDQQRGAIGEARIEVAGLPGLTYAADITRGSSVEIDALRIDGTAVPIFRGTVVSLEPQLDREQLVVLIRAAGATSEDGVGSRTPLLLDAGPDGDARLLAFAPRLSASSSIQEVLVTGTDGATGLPISGRAVAPTVRLGVGSDAPFGRTVTIETGRSFSSTDEADAFAALLLAELLEPRISAEIVATGSPDIRLGTFVEIKGIDARFEGAYYVSGVSHRFGPDSYGGFSSSLRLRRADLGMFFIPDIDDEVLVAFDHGDFDRPYVVDSWWDCGSRPRSESPDDNDQCRLLRWPW